jgi:hypothetical protein
MRLPHCVTSMGLALAVGTSLAEGLKVDAAGGYWFGSETRLRLHAQPLAAPALRLGDAAWPAQSLWQPRAGSLTGDYYFSAARPDDGLARSGFRASSALLIREGGISLADVAMSSRSSLAPGRPAGLLLGDAQGYAINTMPYVGIGYSGLSLKSGWGFWADVGLVVQSPGHAFGVGRVLSGNQGVDELLRELRMAPMVQLGVNYAF